MKIPVLYYHEVVPKGQGYTYQKIEEDEFEQQLKYLKDHGYTTISFKEADTNISKIKKPIIITFDDGFRTVYRYAYPLLQKYAMKATLFLAPKYIDENNDYYLSWDMVREMSTKGGIEIGSHTYTHIDMRSLDKENLLEEFRQADSSIKRETGIKSKVICFPYGVFNIQTIRALNEYGNYRYYVASFFGRTNFTNKKKLIQRLGIKSGDSLVIFERKLKGKESYRGVVQFLRIVKSGCLHRYQNYRIDF
jgi:peptidoglycan/xylan/chitin deacetylase (PgdA/CDA1 family)